MDLSRLLDQGGTVKIEVTVDDLYQFAEFILDKHSKINKSLEKPLPEYGAYDLAMKITGYAESTIRNKVSKGQIPFKKVQGQGKVWFSRTELLQWMNSGNTYSNLDKYMK